MKRAEQEYLRRAFELAYFIHPNVEVALSIAEEAVCKLDYTFGKQGRRVQYVPGRTQDGGETPQTSRTKVNLNEQQLLQLLVYAESDFWERTSEYAATTLRVTEEDLVIRFVKHLVQISLKRNSFYVTLGIGRLLYDYDTSQVRQMYDLLMQDQERFRDNSYLRKQKNVLIRELLSRFGGKIRTVRTPQREIRFVTQPRTEPLLSLVRGCLERFAPWDTTCVLPAVFDPMEHFSELSFSGADPEQESTIETNRIHTVIHPECFRRLITNLGFVDPDERLGLPKFFLSEDDSPPGDRLNPPPLSEKDELRLNRARRENAQRRKSYRGSKLSVYVDEIEQATFDTSHTSSLKLEIAADANVLEVRARDRDGEFTLAMLLVTPNIPVNGSLEDAVRLEGGQEVKVVLTRPDARGRDAKNLNVEVRYRETYLTRSMLLAAHRVWHAITGGGAAGASEESGRRKPAYGWMLVVTASLVLVTSVMIVVWWQTKPLPVITPPEQRAEKLPTPQPEVSPSPKTSPKQEATLHSRDHPIVSIAWVRDDRALDNAIRLETRRGSAPRIPISKAAAVLEVAVNRSNAEEREYNRYRLVLTADEKSIFEQVLQPPRLPEKRRAYVLRLALTPERFPKAESFKLKVDGEARSGWESVGEIVLLPAGK